MKQGTTTGSSAFDRSLTIRALIDKKTKSSDLARPGHIFPLRAVKGGVLRRAGHTEATVDLARLGGFYPAGVLCEIMDNDGSMARLPQLKKIAKRFDLKIITIKDLIEYRRRKEKLIERVLENLIENAIHNTPPGRLHSPGINTPKGRYYDPSQRYWLWHPRGGAGPHFQPVLSTG